MFNKISENRVVCGIFVEKCGTVRGAIADSTIPERASILPYSTFPTLFYFELFQTSLNKAHKLRRSHMTVEFKRTTSQDNIKNIINILSAFKSMAVTQMR